MDEIMFKMLQKVKENIDFCNIVKGNFTLNIKFKSNEECIEWRDKIES